jgi:hypothetical protein
MTMDGKIHYMVTWIIDVYANTPREAAAEAQNIMQDPGCDWVFDITNVKTKITTREDLNIVELDEHKVII